MKKLALLALCTLSLSALVDCDDVNGPTTGSIEVSTSTTGEDLDPDGYTCSLDGLGRRSVGINDTEIFSGVTTGEHAVQLTDVEDNCAVAGSDTRTASVYADQTAEVNFDVTCAALTGSLQVTTVTSGDTLDPDGYTLTVEGTQSQSVDINAAVTFPGLREGSYTVELSGVAKNCIVSGENPRSVSIAAGQTTEETFQISCAVALFDHIAFSSYRDGNYEVYVMDADGSNPINLTNDPAIDYESAWSPDGTKIAFQSHRDGNREIYVMNADGWTPINLTDDPSAECCPGWSPDGTKIAFASLRDGNEEVYVMDADGSNSTRLTYNTSIDEPGAWSPDGTRIAFWSDRDGNGEVYVMNADGSSPTRLTDNPSHDSSPAWSPDGKKIGFVSGRDGNCEIYVMKES
jgi:WD40 repeat protein